MATPANDQSSALGMGIVIALLICMIDGYLVKGIVWLLLMAIGMPAIWTFYIAKTYQDSAQRFFITVGIAAALSALVLLF